MAKKQSGTRVRSSVTGKFVPPREAAKNPRETETERVKKQTKKS